MACSLAALALSVLASQAGSNYTPYAFTNFAGTVGVLGTADGTGTAARFSAPAGVATDPAGNLYVADGANTIRKITPAGVVSTLAGSPGQVGTNDDVGSAARFNSPVGVATDSAGNVYVADSANHTIRKITPAGAVSTLAGSPGQYGSSDGTNSAARFALPMGLAVDSAGNIYVADSGNNTVRKLSPAGLVTTLAGNPAQVGFGDGIGGAAQFFSPQGVAVDSAGNVFVAEETDDMIRKVTPAGTVTTVAGSPSLEGSSDGIGSKALFYGPVGVAVDSLGNLYVADANNLRITRGTQAFLQFRSITGSLTLSSGAFHAWLTGPPNSRVILEASGDLRSWTAVQTNVLPAGGMALSVPLNATAQGFVRSRLGP